MKVAAKWFRVIPMKPLQWVMLVLCPVLILSTGLLQFPFPASGAAYTDLLVTHYPNAVFVKNTIAANHVVPLWSDMIMSGYPFAGDPLSGLFYPPGWIALLFPLPLGFNLLVIAHLILAGVGMTLYLQSMNIHENAALLGGVVFELMPKLFAHYGAGHLTLLYAIAWTPWFFLAGNTIIKRKGSVRAVILAAVILSLIITADPRWAVYAGGLWGFYMLAHSHYIDNGIPLKTNLRNRLLFFWGNFKVIMFTGIISLLLSAPLLLPLLEFVKHSTRNLLEAKNVLTYSLPPGRLLGLFFPIPKSFHEWTIYSGGIVLVFVVISIVGYYDNPDVRFWGLASIFLVIISLGSNIGVAGLFAKIPGIRLLRVPPRSFFATGFAFGILSAIAADRMFYRKKAINKFTVRLVLMGWGGFVGLIALGLSLATHSLPTNILWGVLACFAGVVIVLLAIEEKANPNVLFMMSFILILADLVLFDTSAVVYKNKDEINKDARILAETITADKEIFRVYSPSYSLPQNVAMNYGLELADGVNPLQLIYYAEYMQKAAGVPAHGYSVTIPPFENGDPASDNQGYLPDPELLGLLNVKYVVSAFEIDTGELTLIKRMNRLYWYRNEKYRPRVWMENEISSKQGQVSYAKIVQRTPNSIRIRADGAGLLVLSEIAYPGWKVFVDGKNAEMLRPHGILRGVALSEGRHSVAFVFTPMSVFWGTGIFFLVLLVLLIVWFNHQKVPPIIKKWMLR